MGHRLKVLHLTKGLDLGGAERIVALLAELGDSSEFDYSVAYALAGLDDLEMELRSAGVEVHCLGARHDFDLRWAGALRRLLQRDRFDVVHLHLPYTAGVGRVVAWSLGTRRRPRLVYTQHNVWRHTAPATRLLGRMTWWMDDADLVVSHAALDALPPALRRRSEVLLHGIDTATALPSGTREEVRAELGVGEGVVLVVSVANLREEKGYEVLLAAAKKVLDEGLPVRFVAVGHGPLEAEVRAEHARLGLGAEFFLAGMRRDVGRILAGSDVFVLASHHEGFPLAVMEALAAGVPVVATSVGDVATAVRHGVDGLVVPPGDPDALAGALGEVVRDSPKRAAMTAAARAGAARFDIRDAIVRIEEVYRRLVPRAREASFPVNARATPRATPGS